jgi:hypothetical protein
LSLRQSEPRRPHPGSAEPWLGANPFLSNKLPKIRRKDNELWRQKHYKTIFGIAKNVLGWSEDQIHQFASTKLGKRVVSLSDLGEQDLARLARWIRAESKKK